MSERTGLNSSRTSKASVGLAHPEADRLLTWASWLLRFALLGYAVGLTGLVWQKLGTHTGSYLFMHHGIPHATVAVGERVAAVLLLILVAGAMFRPRAALVLPAAATAFVEAYCGYLFGGYHFAEWTPAAHMMRYAAPLALVLLVMFPAAAWWSSRRRLIAGAWVLRVGLACLFATHGLEAIRLHPGFLDLIIGTGENVLGMRISESQAGLMLRLIGGVDLLVALAVLVYPARVVLAWLAFWGLLTAVSRVTALGPGHWHEILLRSAHVLGPVALWQLMAAIYQFRHAAQQAAGAKREAASRGAEAAGPGAVDSPAPAH